MSKISVLIPTYNAGSDIRLLMNKLISQEVGNNELEIIVVDSSSSDETVNVISEEFPEVKIKVIENHCFNHGGTRNDLASLSNGDYLLFLTQDAIPYDNYLIKNLLDSFKDPRVVVSYARQIPKKGAYSLEAFARSFNYPEKSMTKSKHDLKRLGVKTFFNSNVCSMYKKSVFDEIGGFPEKIIMNEDMIFAAQAIFKGFSIAYVSEAKVYHSHNYNLKQQFKRYFDIGMFFQEMSYLKNYASNEKEGVRMILKQMRHLFQVKKPHYIPKAITESIVKYIAYNLGMRHNKLSYQLKKKLSAYMK